MTEVLWGKLIDKVVSARFAAFLLCFMFIGWGAYSGMEPAELVKWGIVATVGWIISDGERPAELPGRKVKRLAREALASHRPETVLGEEVG